jgi:hypothetical protein
VKEVYCRVLLQIRNQLEKLANGIHIGTNYRLYGVERVCTFACVSTLWHFEKAAVLLTLRAKGNKENTNQVVSQTLFFFYQNWKESQSLFLINYKLIHFRSL